jgi:hypothetical protein
VNGGGWILQIFINKKETEIRALQKRCRSRKANDLKISIVHVPAGGGWTPQEIRDKLLENLSW